MKVPDSITSWVGEATALSTSQGLGIAEPSLLKTFKPFFVDFTLPRLIIRGEQVKIPLSVYNYMGICTEVLSPQIYSLLPFNGELGLHWCYKGGRSGTVLAWGI